MPRHSKNNTALSFFTREEKEKLGYGTQKVRMGRSYCLDFDVCGICLQCAREPVICTNGHLTCRECSLKSLLQQKQQNLFKQQIYENKLKEIQLDNFKKEKEEHEKEVKRFEDSQVLFNFAFPIVLLGKINVLPASSGNKRTLREDGKTVIEASKEILYANIKRSKKIIEEDNSIIIPEAVKADEKTLTSFWIPSLTPTAEPSIPVAPSLSIYCYGSYSTHKISLKKLVKVNFLPVHKNEPPEKQEKTNRWKCPGCTKSLTNNKKMFVLLECGHVICDLCVNQFIKKEKSISYLYFPFNDPKVCPFCSKTCDPNTIIQIKHEGTGYAGHGENLIVESYELPFQ